MTMTTASLNSSAHTRGTTDDHIDPEAKPARQTFRAEYKEKILAEYDGWPKGSERRCDPAPQGLVLLAHLGVAQAGRSRCPGGVWRKWRQRRSAEQNELDKLRRQNERLAAELKRTQTALEITGKVHALLEQLSESADTEPKSKP